MVFVYKKLAQFAVPCALPPRRSESPVCATVNKPSCVLHLLGWFIGLCGFSSLERRPEFWVLHLHTHQEARNQLSRQVGEGSWGAVLNVQPWREIEKGRALDEVNAGDNDFSPATVIHRVRSSGNTRRSYLIQAGTTPHECLPDIRKQIGSLS